jgi:NIMA (never in mitosis gene a)-related kinase
MASLRNFEQLNKLGEGAYSTVFKVRRRSDNMIYALKKVKMMTLKEKEKHNSVNEVRILASINHPNIIEYKECFLDDTTNNLWIIMEYADGGDLLKKISTNLKTRKYFEEVEIWKMLVCMLQGLKALHDRKILHRDLKCANIFMLSDGTVKLGDLNVSKVAERGLVYTQTGTPYYASPEVWKDKPYDLKSDIWSLGCVLYEVAALNPPFRAADMQGLYKKVITGVYPPIPNQYSDDLAAVLKTMLQVDPKLRPTCDKLLSMPIVARNIHIQDIAYDESIDLLKTIKVPRNINLLQEQLPAANYERKRSYPGSERASVGRPMIPRHRMPTSEQTSIDNEYNRPSPRYSNARPALPRDGPVGPPKSRNYRVSPNAQDYSN